MHEVYTSFSPPVSHRPATEISLGSRESSKPSKFLTTTLPRVRLPSSHGRRQGSTNIVHFVDTHQTLVPEAAVHYQEIPEVKGPQGIHVESQDDLVVHPPAQAVLHREELPGQGTQPAFKVRL